MTQSTEKCFDSSQIFTVANAITAAFFSTKLWIQVVTQQRNQELSENNFYSNLTAYCHFYLLALHYETHK